MMLGRGVGDVEILDDGMWIVGDVEIWGVLCA